jgi:hypothetical protein
MRVVFSTNFLKGLGFELGKVSNMLSNGKLLIYAPNETRMVFHEIEKVKSAAYRIARRLNLGVEVIQRIDLKSIWVYFESCNGELVPIYFNYGLSRREEEVYAKIRNMMFVLSFHPKFSGLKSIREEVIGLS